jgi:hypothetical protein
LYHPAVFMVPKRCNGFIFGVSEDDVMLQLTNTSSALSCPANIDAAIDYVKDPLKYQSRNSKLRTNIEHLCGKCLQPMSDREGVNYSCLNCCVSHIRCVEHSRECPSCLEPYCQ